MILTPFGDLEYESRPMTRQWLAAHAFRHSTLRKALSRRGSSIQPVPLTGELDLEWVRLHYLHHASLLRYMHPDPTVSVNTLSADPTTSEALFYNWHRMHNLLHQRLDQALKVV